MRRLLPPLVAVLASSGLAGCAQESADGGREQAATAASAPPEEITWEQVSTPDECECSDGSEFHYWVHEGSADKVAFVLEGGGACFSAATCGPTGGTSTVDLADDAPAGPGSRGEGDGAGAQGLLDLGDPDNPLAGYSVVYVPYCTDDLHLGDRTQDYGDDVVVEHKGRINATTALEGMG